MRTERCKRCPYEDTEACEDCPLVKKDMEDKLKKILDKESEKIGGKPIAEKKNDKYEKSLHKPR